MYISYSHSTLYHDLILVRVNDVHFGTIERSHTAPFHFVFAQRTPVTDMCEEVARSIADKLKELNA
jgi:hypothetical protein